MESKSKNTVCHWCRRSKNRIYANKFEFKDCFLCDKTYCNICIKKFPQIAPNNEGCLRCLGKCSCVNDSSDIKCYTSSRNIIEHEKNPNMKEYNKRKDIKKDKSENNTKEYFILNEDNTEYKYRTNNLEEVRKPSFSRQMATIAGEDYDGVKNTSWDKISEETERMNKKREYFSSCGINSSYILSSGGDINFKPYKKRRLLRMISIDLTNEF